MKRILAAALSTLALCAPLSIASRVRADFQAAPAVKAPLNSGMSVGEVITSWGPPTEKVEHESRRSEVWSYPQGKVVFQEGRLVLYPSAPETHRWDKLEAITVASSAPKHVAPPPPSAQAEVSATADKQDLLRDILNDLPPDEDAKSGNHQPPGPPGNARSFGAHRAGLDHSAQ